MTLTEALKIVKCGFDPKETYKGLSVININRSHELHQSPLLPFQPFTDYSEEGNVAFSTADIRDLDKLNIYYIDFVECDLKTTVINLLLTTENYENLLPVDLSDSKNAIFKIDNIFYYNTEWNAKHISIRFLVNPKDSTFPNNVSYVTVNRHEEQITMKEGKIKKSTRHVFTDSLLGYLFYCLLKYEGSTSQEKFEFSNNVKCRDDLCQILKPPNVPENFDHQLAFLLDGSEEVKEADIVMRKLKIPRSFSFGVNTDFEDSDTMQNLKGIFKKDRRFIPSPSGCIQHILEILCRYYEEKSSFGNCENVLLVFLNHFCDAEERDLVSKSFYVFVRDLWK